MKWQGRRQSSNVEDRRGQRGAGGGRGMPMLPIGGGLGLIIMVILFFLQGGLGGGTQPAQQQPANLPTSAEEEQMYEFAKVVLADTEDVWHDLFAEQGYAYSEPTLVVFTDSVQSACGVAGSSTGPFYCPGDHKLYIDLSFFHELSTKYGASGEFAMAYVIAHEVGHHVQTLLGLTDQVFSLKDRMSESEFNRYLVRFELQADYFAGVWAHHIGQKGYLEAGDIDEALNAAYQIGDDTLQKRSQGYVVPDSFTHGTSEQRSGWFKKGYEYGTIADGDTFNMEDPR